MQGVQLLLQSFWMPHLTLSVLSMQRRSFTITGVLVRSCTIAALVRVAGTQAITCSSMTTAARHAALLCKTPQAAPPRWSFQKHRSKTLAKLSARTKTCSSSRVTHNWKQGLKSTCCNPETDRPHDMVTWTVEFYSGLTSFRGSRAEAVTYMPARDSITAVTLSSNSTPKTSASTVGQVYRRGSIR